MNKNIYQWKCRGHLLTTGDRPLIMGVVNVTPDSFFDGGIHASADSAVAHAMRLIEQGADIIDIGGESTRPGAAEVPKDEELARVIPVLENIRKRTDIVISVDTMKAEVAREAIMAGADVINDVSAMARDLDMVEVARESGVGVVLMHMQGSPRTMQSNPSYGDVVSEVAAYLKSRIDDLTARGVDRLTLAVDPGIGFGKTLDHNLDLLAGLDAFGICDRPVVVGLSRKSFLGGLTGRDVEGRLAGSLAALVFCVLNGAHVMRVHDVRESLDAVKVAMALKQHRNGSSSRVE